MFTERARSAIMFLATGLVVASFLNDAGAGADDPAKTDKLEKATFAGGCFWCMQPPFDKLDGVVSTTVGYTGGIKKNPNYKEVCSGETGHTEAIQVLYDPKRVTYAELLDVFWRNIDPTTPNRQFCDVGTQYRTAIFYHNEEQRQLAEETRKELEGGNCSVSRPRLPRPRRSTRRKSTIRSTTKRPVNYKSYRTGCGRDERLRVLWGKSKKESH